MCYINSRTSKFVQVINESTVTLNTTNMIDWKIIKNATILIEHRGGQRQQQIVKLH